MAEIEMSRDELIEKLARLAFVALKPYAYELRTLAAYLSACAQEFGITPDEQKEVIVSLTTKVVSDDIRGRRSTDGQGSP